MGNRRPQQGERYRHFKNKMYQIIAIAKHSETKEELVIYQALYDDFGIYARPLDMFVSEVDHEKYPEIKQKYRFEKVDAEGNSLEIDDEAVTGSASTVSGENAMPSTADVASDVDGVHPLLMKFLDAETVEERYKILVSMRNEITDQMIDSMAVVCDVVIPEGDIFIRYENLKYALMTRQKYEVTNRLR